MQINAIIVYITTENDGKMHKNGGYVCEFKACGDGSIDDKGKIASVKKALI